ncbi:hypothetical protein FACS189487_02090 [Campylobacterota bacterium]|nr:hypothetical protein FACS189487_02090 [Campylobacterota bacterium]
MQTFSGMQRDSFNFNDIVRCVAFLALFIVYESLSTIYYFLPPLFGFCFALAAVKKEPRFMWAVIVYILFYESEHSLITGSGALFLYIFIKYIMPVLEDFIMSRYVIMIIAVLFAYFGYYIFINALYFVFGANTISFSWFLIYYAAIEATIAVIVLD